MDKSDRKGDSPVLTRQCRNSHVQGPLVTTIILLRPPRQLRADTLREAVGPPFLQAQHFFPSLDLPTVTS